MLLVAVVSWLLLRRGNELLRSLQNVCQDLWLMTLTPLLTWLGLRLWTIWMIMKQNQVSMIHSVSTHHWASYIRVGQNLSIVITSDNFQFCSLRIEPGKACVSFLNGSTVMTVNTLFSWSKTLIITDWLTLRHHSTCWCDIEMSSWSGHGPLLFSGTQTRHTCPNSTIDISVFDLALTCCQLGQ